MRLDPFFDIRMSLLSSVRTGDESALAANARPYIERLLNTVEAIEAECTFSEDHANGWDDTPTVYAESIRDAIRHYGTP